MLFAMHFIDHADSQDLRARHYTAHHDWLRANGDRILVVGLLKPAPDEPHVGAFWIVHADTREQAIQLADGDPFWQAGLRRFREVFHYQAVSSQPLFLERGAAAPG